LQTPPAAFRLFVLVQRIPPEPGSPEPCLTLRYQPCFVHLPELL
jgi:hypothetical protein